MIHTKAFIIEETRGIDEEGRPTISSWTDVKEVYLGPVMPRTNRNSPLDYGQNITATHAAYTRASLPISTRLRVGETHYIVNECMEYPNGMRQLLLEKV